MNIKDANGVIDYEIKWCFDNPDESLSKDYRKGFTNGLVQAKYLINQLASQQDVEAGEFVCVRSGNCCLENENKGCYVDCKYRKYKDSLLN